MEKKINEAVVKSYNYVHNGVKLNFSVTTEEEKKNFYALFTEACADLKVELKMIAEVK